MILAGLADDAVRVRQARVSGMQPTTLRHELQFVPTPKISAFVFIRRVRLRAGPDRVRDAMATALAKIAADGGREMLTYPDFAALCVACAGEAASTGLGAWQWRMLGLPRVASPGEAVALLLTRHPLDANTAVAALARQGLLAGVWRSMPGPAAARLTMALAEAAGLPLPALSSAAARPAAHASLPDSLQALVARAADFWLPSLAGLPPRAEPVMAAAILSLLRWSPGLLRQPDSQALAVLLDHFRTKATVPRNEPPPRGQNPLPPSPGGRGLGEGVLPAETERLRHATPHPALSRIDGKVAPQAALSGSEAAWPEDRHTGAAPAPATYVNAVETEWGGVLFLLNAFRRLGLDRFDPEDDDPPTAWRWLHDAGVSLGMPADEPLARFLAEQDLQTAIPRERLAAVLHGLEHLYAEPGPWPLPLAQSAVLRATETHLDLHLAAPAVDPALRIAGLDLDPGWLPWLGRVVKFHYDAVPTYHARPR
jgi:hypothetical protein